MKIKTQKKLVNNCRSIGLLALILAFSFNIIITSQAASSKREIIYNTDDSFKGKNNLLSISSIIDEKLKKQAEVAAKAKAQVEAKAKAEEEAKRIVTVIDAEPATEFLGTFELTAYCSCFKCCSKEDGITKSGTHVTEGRTVACNSIPLGTVIYIEGYGTYTVEDTGAMGDNVVDIFFNSHQTALDFGRQTAKVYIVK